MALKLTNDARSTLAAAAGRASTTLTIQPADAGLFPALAAGAGDWCPLALVDAGGNMEIVRATARAGNIITVLRAREGTASRAWPAGTVVEPRLTAAAIEEFALSSETYLKGEADTLLDAKVSQTRTIQTSGLATGGGNLTQNRTIEVTPASLVEAEAGTVNNKAMTPLRVAQAIPASKHTAVLRRITARVVVGSSQYTKPAWLKYVLVYVYGGGGGWAATPAAGGASSFGVHCSATGGAAGTNTNANAPGGIGSGGDINLQGEAGGRKAASTSAHPPVGGGRAAGPHGGPGGQGSLQNGGIPPGGGGGASASADPRTAGGGGGCSIKLILATELTANTLVTVGAAGANGARGAVYILEYGGAG